MCLETKGCDYTNEYTKVHTNADVLSRFPLATEIRNEEVVDPVGVFNLMQFDPLTRQRLARNTERTRHFGRRLRTRLDLLKPDFSIQVNNCQID